MIGSQEVVRTAQGLVLWDIPRFAVALILVAVGGLAFSAVYGFFPSVIRIVSTEAWLVTPWARGAAGLLAASLILGINARSLTDYRVSFDSHARQMRYRDLSPIPFSAISGIKVLPTYGMGHESTARELETYVLGAQVSTEVSGGNARWIVIDSVSYLVLAQSLTQDRMLELERELRAILDPE